MPRKYPNSDHHRNGYFFNPDTPAHLFSDFLRWYRNRDQSRWRRDIPSEPGPKPPARVNGPELRVTFINHATVLLQTEGLSFITDPIWSQRASPSSFAGPRRHRVPGIRFEDLPTIDAILMSHNHYDHLDVGTLRRLLRRDSPTIFCPLGVAPILKRIGFREIHELDWWQSVTWKNLEFHCTPAQHFSARSAFDRNRTLWCGWRIDFAAGAVYFAGDTGYGKFFHQIRERSKDIRLALLPIGAFRPEWFMGPVHMTPEQAVEAHGVLNAATSMAIHFGTFSLADDGETEAVGRLNKCLDANPPQNPFWLLREGEGRIVP
jgi:L-ascorbate metabolism protein UlaG (beta-lactamase superfamily)